MFECDEYILDIKLEDTQIIVNRSKSKFSPEYEIDDIDSNCSTISATESEATISASEANFKQKKLRVLIKKLPQKVLDQYFNKMDLETSMAPSRVSNRVKIIPSKFRDKQFVTAHASKPGKYIEILDTNLKKNTTQSLPQSKSLLKEMKSLGIYNNNNRIKNKKLPKSRSLLKEMKSLGIYNNKIKNKELKALGISDDSLTITKTKRSSYLNILKKTRNQSPKTVSNKIDNVRRSLPQSKPLNKELKSLGIYDNSTTVQRQSLPQSKSLDRELKSLGNSDNSLTIQQQSLPSTKSVNKEMKSLGISKNSLTISKTIRASYLNKINKTTNQLPQTVPNKIDTVTLNSSNILVIKQPVLRTDPLNVQQQAINTELPQTINEGIETQTDQETIAEVSTEPEVIKRIFYASKSVQTKFTCNSSICGLVDFDEFNINCFYCYKIFPHYKWLEFKQHVKIQHHVEEKQNEIHEPIEELIFKKPTPIKPIVNTHLNPIKVKSTDDLSRKTSIAETYFISDKDKLSINKPMNRAVKFIEVKKKSPPLTTIQLSPPKEKSTNNNQINQLIDLTSVPEKSPKKTIAHNIPLPQSNEFIDLSSDNEKRKSPSPVDFNTSYVDEIINIDDDNEETLDVSDDLQPTSPKLTTFKNPNTNTNNGKTMVLPPSKNLPITKNISFPKPHNTTPVTLPKLPIHMNKNITIKRLTRSPSKTTGTSVTSPEAPKEKPILKKAYIKLPTNLSIEDVLKTIPKPTAPQNSSITGSTKPRYFVVKKVIKPGANIKDSTMNLPKDTVVTKLPSPTTKQDCNEDDDDMPSNDENEDDVPKPTNGCGILFGLTHRTVVVEFLLKLKTYPELWRPHLNNANIDYDDSIQQLCSHLNEKFDLDIKDFEMRLSIQRVKDWYCRMLKSVFNHNKDLTKTEPYKHTFPEYFDILNKFLTSDVHYTKNLLLGKRFKATNTSMSDYPKWMVYKPGQNVNLGRITEKKIIPKEKPKPKSPKKKPTIRFNPTQQTEDDSTQNVIEFDADTLYAVDSSSDESLALPPDPKPKKYVYKKATKIYNPAIPFECDICKRTFKRNTDLQRHRVHHFPPQFKCATCSKMFFQKYLAQRCSHTRRKHINEFANYAEHKEPITVKSLIPSQYSTFRPWMCDVCGMSYRSVGSLKAHMNDKHFNARLKCGVCKFTANSNYRIVQHQTKRHIVEPGTAEEIAKKCRARTDSKTPFSVEAKQEFLWRREMRKNLEPGQKLNGCLKCRIVFNSRKEKILHNKLEHPIKDTTVICLKCHPEKLMLANSNSVRRHYRDMHKVPWYEIDDLVKRTKPVFKLLTKDEIEQLNSAENCSELLNQIIVKRNIKLDLEPVEDESTKATEHLTNDVNQQFMPDQGVKDDDVHQQFTTEQGVKDDQVAIRQDENVYVDGIIDHDYNYEQNEQHPYENQEYHDEQHDEQNYNENQENINNEQYQDVVHNNDGTTVQSLQYQNDQEEIHVDDDGYPLQYENEVVDGELVEESVVVDEFVEEGAAVMLDGIEEFY